MSTAALIRATLGRLDARRVSRGFAAGIAWGVLVAAGLTALESWRCGAICLDSAAFTALLSAAIGIVTIGPLAAIGRPGRPT
jgi:hypothetical protein